LGDSEACTAPVYAFRRKSSDSCTDLVYHFMIDHGDTMPYFRHQPIVESPADRVIEGILREIAVRDDVLAEARRRRNLVRRIALRHDAARRTYNSGSIAHGTHNAPLGDADCGVVIDRRLDAFRAFGPDAGPGARGPEPFYQLFAAFIEPQVRDAGYPKLELDLSGNRAIKFIFNEPVEFDELGPVDPYVDLIVALRRDEDHKGLWIPNRRAGWWDAAHPERHTWLMTQRDPRPLSVHRAHVVRLGKRAVKRDGARPGGTQVICSWNLSALSLNLVDERLPLATALAGLFDGAARSIARTLTDDPAGVAGPIQLPDGVSQDMAARRLAEMATIVSQAIGARSEAGARAALAPLFGTELEVIRAREQAALTSHPVNGAIRERDPARIAGALGATVLLKRTASDGD
jgi:hypothetical protein